MESVVWHDSSRPESEPRAVIIAGGDFCPVRRIEKRMLEGRGVFGKRVLESLEPWDMFMVNLEAVLCGEGLAAASASGYGLRAVPEIAGHMRKSGIDCAGIANNHILDFSDAGVASTAAALEKAGIKHFGAGMNRREAEKAFFFSINGINICVWALAEKELNIAGHESAGAAAFEPEANVKSIAELKKESDFLAIYAHAGHEFMPVPSPRIRDSYRRFIDAGADAVIGHHPHVVQGIEKYGAGWIFYSLGNLVFDSPYVSAYPMTGEGAIARLTISRGGIARIELVFCRTDSDFAVRTMGAGGRGAFESFLRKISSAVTDDEKFFRAWEKNVILRWEQDYKKLMAEYSSRLFDPDDLDFPRMLRNHFTCPTHSEIMGKISLLIEQGKIKRDLPG